MPTILLGGLQELAHYAAAIPLLVCWGMSLRGQDPKPDTWILACAFFVSVIADSVQGILQDRHLNNQWVNYVYPPIQFSIFLFALIHRPLVRGLALVLVWLLAVASLVQGPLTQPEAVVQAAGGAFVGFFVISTPSGRTRRAIVTYCLGTIPWLMLLAALPLGSTLWIAAWVLYQLTRLVSLGLMALAIVSPEAARGRRNMEGDPPVGRRTLALISGHPAHAKPTAQKHTRTDARRVATR